MKIRTIALILVLTFAPTVLMAAATSGSKTCQWKDEAALKTHLTNHIKYPATGKQIEKACVKEIPNEFTKAERQCMTKKLSKNKTYNSSDDAMADLGMK
jgi:hypothetical protein